MVLDVAALLILCLFAGIGALRGGLASLSGLVTLVLAYFAAVFGAQHLGGPVGEKLGVPPLFAPIFAGTAAFVATVILVGGLGTVLKRIVDGFRGDAPISSRNRWLGAALGLVRGVFVVLMLGWLAIWIDAWREASAHDGLAAAPAIEDSSLVQATEVVVKTAVEAAMGDDAQGREIVVRFASRPGRSVRSLQAVLADRRIEALQRDAFFWTLVSNGSYARAASQKSFGDVVASAELRGHFSELGVISEEARDDPQAFRRELGAVLVDVGPRVRDLAEDPELRALARSPEIASMLEQGDALGLIQHEGVQRLATRIAQK